MKKISKVATGIPLRNTSPAAIEDFLVKKVREDLGELTDIAKIRPVLRVDSEDGDLSGNITNGFGTIMVTVKEKSFHLPFMIIEKELLPFDSIKLGDEEVAYTMGKLRQLVKALNKHEKKDIGSDAMQVVDIRDVPTHNGFLGTILSLRDEHRTKDVNGRGAHEGEAFGDMDDSRMNKRASADVDVVESFEGFHEKLATVKYFSNEDVDLAVETISKQAETESKKMIDSIKEVTLDTKEEEGVKREMARVDSTTLVDAKRSASGNNVRFPVYDENRFEFRNGRVYSKIKNLAAYEGSKPSKITRIVIDSKGEYAFLTANDKFMLDTSAPTVEFDLPEESGRGIGVGNMYAVEMDSSTISAPFTVERSFRTHYQDNGMLISVRERMMEDTDKPMNPMSNSIFRDALKCESTLGESYGNFVLLILKGSDAKMEEVNRENALKDYVAEKAENPTDASNANFLATYLGASKYFTIGENAKVFKMSRKIAGYFTRPDGLFKEGPLFHKEAAYDQSNKARLRINEQAKPATYSVEWSFTKEEDVEGESAYNMEKREMKDLAPAQAKKVLGDLGYDARKQAMFFEIAKRNGRYAEFRLPDVSKAAEVSPKDVGMNKAKKAFTNIANSTLNAKNFVPAMQDYAVEAGTNTAKDVSDRFAKQASTSREVAIEFEKIAEQIRGKEWSELAYLLNMKYNLDKLACQINEGFVKDAEPVFKEAASMQGAIEKKASLLLNFNRQQLVARTKPLVDPVLIKQALQQFDEFSGYIAVQDVMEKQASFFHKSVRNNLQGLEQKVVGLQGTQKDVMNKLRSEIIFLRTLEQKGLQGTPKHVEVSERTKALQQQAEEIASELGNVGREQSDLKFGMERKNRAGMAAVGLPGLAGLSYGYQNFKEE